MPPKAKVEAVVSVDIPDQPPSLDSDVFVDELLQKARAGNAVAVEQGVSHALSLDDFKFNLRSGIAVDFVVEVVLFAAEHGYGPRKTLSVLQWLTSLRNIIVAQNGETAEARQHFKQFLVSQVERHHIEQLQPSDQHDAVQAQQEAEKAQQAAAPGGKKPDAKKAAAKVVEDAPQVSPRQNQLPYENPFISANDVAPLARFAVQGVLQHSSLYHHVFTADRLREEAPIMFSFSLELPSRPPPLARAMKQADYDAGQRAAEAKVSEELSKLRQEEQDRLEAARKQEEQRLQAQREFEEEQKNNMLYFSKAGTEPAVTKVQQDVESTLSQRQRDVLARLARLEAELLAK